LSTAPGETRALVVGYGNALRSDDGFGWHAAQQLSTELQGPNIEVIARQQLTPDLAETVSHFQLVIFIDAARDLPGGELRCARISASENRRQTHGSSFTHSLAPEAVLAWAAELYARVPDAYYISVGGESFAEGEFLSPIMQSAIEPLTAQVRSLVVLVDQRSRLH
jgi:hydrogenase maturation protease